jgi:hypothetical protein
MEFQEKEMETFADKAKVLMLHQMSGWQAMHCKM